MRTEECISLIRGGVRPQDNIWADLGSGDGAFTAALAVILGPGGTIWSVDTDAGALRTQEADIGRDYPGVRLRTLTGDFTTDLSLPPLDGALIANALHFQADACVVLAHVSRWLRPGGRIVLVEYDVTEANPWVPHPVPYARLPEVAQSAGLPKPRLLATRPSRYQGRMYAAVLAPPDSG